MLIAVGGFAIRVIYLYVVGPHAPLGWDAIWYTLEGHAIADGHGYIDPRLYLDPGTHVPTAYFPPLWPTALAAFDHLGLGSTWSNRLVGSFFGVVTIVLSGLVGRRVAGSGVGIVAATVVACCPMLIAADGSLMSESLYVMLILATVLGAYRAIERPTALRYALVGLPLGLAAITRADALFLAPIMLVALLWRVPGAAALRRLGLAASLVGVLAIPTVAWTAYSSARMDGLVLGTSNSGNALTGANCPSTYYAPLLGANDDDCAWNFEPGEDEREWVGEAREAGVDYAREHAKRLPLVIPARVLRTWGLWDPVQQTDLEQLASRNVPWQYLGWAYDLVMLATAVGGAVLLRRRQQRIGPLVAVILGVVVTAAVSNGNQRFRLAADPVLAVLAAVAIVAVAARRWGTRSDTSGEAVTVDRSR